MRVLYHFKMSTFSRRARLAIAHKGLECELREGRSTPAYAEEAKKLYPIGTMPVLVDGDHVIGDSGAITHYLDRAYEGNSIWPKAPADFAHAARLTALVDGVADIVVDLGNRYYALCNDPNWKALSDERIERAQKSLELLEKSVENKVYSTDDSWSASDIWLFSLVQWLAGLPARAATTPVAVQILSLGLKLPSGLAAWTLQHKDRADVIALDAKVVTPPATK